MATPSARAGTKGVPRAQREQQILAAATAEFGRRGYEGTSLATVAARVGVTKTLLHQYFGAKQDLYLACLVPVGEQLLTAIHAAMDDTAEASSPGCEATSHRSGADVPPSAEGAPRSVASDATARPPLTAPSDESGPSTPLRVLHGLFTALEGRREAWFVLHDTSLPPGSEAARCARNYRSAIDACAATGTADLLLATDSFDPLDADALSHAWQGLATALVRWWINHPDESANAMTDRCARLFAAARGALGST